MHSSKNISSDIGHEFILDWNRYFNERIKNKRIGKTIIVRQNILDIPERTS